MLEMLINKRLMSTRLARERKEFQNIRRQRLFMNFMMAPLNFAGTNSWYQSISFFREPDWLIVDHPYTICGYPAIVEMRGDRGLEGLSRGSAFLNRCSFQAKWIEWVKVNPPSAAPGCPRLIWWYERGYRSRRYVGWYRIDIVMEKPSALPINNFAYTCKVHNRILVGSDLKKQLFFNSYTNKFLPLQQKIEREVENIQPEGKKMRLLVPRHTVFYATKMCSRLRIAICETW